MTTITLRSTKGAPLTIAEVDANFNNLNNSLPTAMDSATAQAGTSTTAQTVSASVLKAGIDANANVVKTYTSVSDIPSGFDGTARVGTDIYVGDGTSIVRQTKNLQNIPMFVEALLGSGLCTYHSQVESATLTVSGTAGSYYLTLVSGNTTNFSHSAGTIGQSLTSVLQDPVTNTCYFVTVMRIIGPGGAILLSSPLPISVTNATLYNRHLNQQHYTVAGYKALANYIATYNPVHALLHTLRSKYLLDSKDKWDSATTTLPHIWQLSGSSGIKSLTLGSVGVNYDSQGRFTSSLWQGHSLITYPTGTGIATAKLKLDSASSGYIIFEVAALRDDVDATSVTINATTIENLAGTETTTKSTIYTTGVFGTVKRYVVPFSICNEIEIIFTQTATAGGPGLGLAIGKLEIVTGTISAPKKVIEPLDNVLVFGDSWTDPTAGAYGETFLPELARLTNANFVSSFTYAPVGIVKTALSSTTTAYALDWLQLALIANPTVNKVLFHYFTNDNNCASLANHYYFTSPSNTTKDYNILAVAGLTGSIGNAHNIWAHNIQKLIYICLQNGVTPIVIGPNSTFSSGQTDNHANMNYMIGQPQSERDNLLTCNAASLAFKSNPINTRNKYKGKIVSDQQPGGANIALYIANGPEPTDTWSLYGSATTITPI